MTVTVKKAAEEKTPGDDTKPEDETKPGDDTKPEDEKPQGFTIYFANNKKWTEVNATFFNRETGEKFSDFLVNDVIPYIEKNYNTNSVRGFAGSSNGGLEAFYIGMEHPGLFSYIGVISPAMDFFASETWDEYLSKKDFSGDTARVYIYCGNQDFIEKLQHDATAEIEGKMKKAGYPADKVVTVLDNDGAHNEGFWAIYFTEMLKFGLQF